MKAPNKYSLTQIKDAIHDGLRAIKNAIDDGNIYNFRKLTKKMLCF